VNCVLLLPVTIGSAHAARLSYSLTEVSLLNRQQVTSMKRKTVQKHDLPARTCYRS